MEELKPCKHCICLPNVDQNYDRMTNGQQPTGLIHACEGFGETLLRIDIWDEDEGRAIEIWNLLQE